MAEQNTMPAGEDVQATEREAGLSWKPEDGARHVGCAYYAAVFETDGGPVWFCNKCGWGAPVTPRKPMKPSYEQLEAMCNILRDEADRATALLRRLRSGPNSLSMTPSDLVQEVDAFLREATTDG